MEREYSNAVVVVECRGPDGTLRTLTIQLDMTRDFPEDPGPGWGSSHEASPTTPASWQACAPMIRFKVRHSTESGLSAPLRGEEQ
jgi:hypothetical protein